MTARAAQGVADDFQEDAMMEVTEEAFCNMALRSAVFDVLRRHDVSEQCFAEVAMVTQAALTTAHAEAEALREALGVAAGRLHWAGSATPGIAHPDGKALVLQWEAETRATLAALERKP